MKSGAGSGVEKIGISGESSVISMVRTGTSDSSLVFSAERAEEMTAAAAKRSGMEFEEERSSPSLAFEESIERDDWIVSIWLLLTPANMLR